jgi:hypothetical protein
LGTTKETVGDLQGRGEGECGEALETIRLAILVEAALGAGKALSSEGQSMGSAMFVVML